MSDRPSSDNVRSLVNKDPLDAIWAVLNGPPGDPEKGLAWITRQNAGAIKDLADLAKRHSLTLYGNGKEGLADQVRTHERIIARAEKALTWIIALIGAEALGVLGYILWWAIRTVPN